MQVKAVSVSKSLVDGVDTPEQLLAYFARVSNAANQLNHETSPRLLKYLVRNKEWSPFEMCHMTVEIHTTRDIARQILRHKSCAFQEFSQRYAKVDTSTFEIRECRLQDTVDRQNSIESGAEDLNKWWKDNQEYLNALTETLYHAALQKGIAKECARAILPEGNTPSHLYMAGSIRSWIHYTDLRCNRKTQLEHRLVANAIQGLLFEHFPSLKGVLVNG